MCDFPLQIAVIGFVTAGYFFAMNYAQRLYRN
jgi:hypothetical protein